jgi:prophage maintenance system killer protein
MAINYLTLQDVLYLSLQLTKSPQPFDYARLEEAVFYQYAPGQSTDLAKQGARFLSGFARMRPFEAGNDAVAFAGLIAFLEANGRSLNVSDESGVAWFHSVVADRGLAEESIRERWGEGPEVHGVPDWESICDDVIARYPKTLFALGVSVASSA